ncbi:hypothetical protein NDU88_003835 [Pleurodeles waltl]|uniref:Uncharacterized protein n=1 Tax=Pleurodeles waltl TaxID=8319 RepID=A0AAV7RJB8_PLEWA|nr:hypothetical protein NDU88_003835 [Pleurodeles waltl]
MAIGGRWQRLRQPRVLGCTASRTSRVSRVFWLPAQPKAATQEPGTGARREAEAWPKVRLRLRNEDVGGYWLPAESRNPGASS